MPRARSSGLTELGIAAGTSLAEPALYPCLAHLLSELWRQKYGLQLQPQQQH